MKASRLVESVLALNQENSEISLRFQRR